MQFWNKIHGTLSSKWIFIAATCLLSFIAFTLTSCSNEKETVPEEKVVRPVKIMTIESIGDLIKRKFPGKVRAAQRVDLAFKVSGPLTELPVEDGQKVSKGDLLARIDPRDFKVDLRGDQGRLSRAKAGLKAMRQARPEDIRRLNAAVDKAGASLKLAKADYNRIMRIYKADPGAVSQSMIDQAMEKKDRAEAELRNAKEELSIGKAGARQEDIQAKKAEIQSLAAAVDAAKDKLGYTSLRAPFSGVIARRYVENYEEVRAKQPIMSLQDVSHIEILVDVPEILMARARDTNAAEVFAEFAATPGKKYNLILKEYSTEADPKTQTYRIVLTMPAPEGINILPGMTASVVGSPPKDEADITRIVVPAIAVFADEAGDPHIWVVDKDTMTVHRRKVTAGDLTGSDSIHVVDGLKTGEMIAISGVSQLREGMEVRKYGK